jgi:hypothetical protein
VTQWRHPRSSFAPAIITIGAAAGALALVAAGCGGGSSPGVASIASSTNAATTQSGLVAYSRCMRSHGMPNFPDPDSRGTLPSLQALGVSKPTWARGDIACKHLLPNGGGEPQETAQQTRTRLMAGLSFARCMRGHGVTRFPDPTAQGDLSVEMVRAQGIVVQSPAVLRAVQACLFAFHGLLTPAQVRAALNNRAPGQTGR